MKPIVWRVPQEPCNQQRRIWKKPGSHTRAYSGNANVKEPNAAKRERGTPLIETSHHHRKRAKSSIASDHRPRAPPSGPATRMTHTCACTYRMVRSVRYACWPLPEGVRLPSDIPLLTERWGTHARLVAPGARWSACLPSRGVLCPTYGVR